MIEPVRALLCGGGVALAAFAGVAGGIAWLSWVAILVAVASAAVRRPFERIRLGSLATGGAVGVLLAPVAFSRFGVEATVVVGVAVAVLAMALPATTAGDRSPRAIGFSGVVALVAAAVALAGREATALALTHSGWDASCAAGAIAAWCATIAIGAGIAARLVARHPKFLRIALVCLPLALVATLWQASHAPDEMRALSVAIHRPDVSHAQFVAGVALFVVRTFGIAATVCGAAIAVAAHVGCRWSGLALAAALAGAGLGVALPVSEPRVVGAATGALALAFLAKLVLRRFGSRMRFAALLLAAAAFVVVPRTSDQREPPRAAPSGSAVLESPLRAPEQLRSLATAGPREDLLVDLAHLDRVDLALLLRLAGKRIRLSGFLGPLPELAPLAEGVRWERLLLRCDRDTLDGPARERRRAGNLRFLARATRADPALVDRTSAELDARFETERVAATADSDGRLEDRFARGIASFFPDLARRDRVSVADRHAQALRELRQRHDADYDDATTRHALGLRLLADRHGQRALAGIDEISRSFELRLVNFDAMVDRDAAMLFAAARGLKKWSPWGPLDANLEVRKSAARLPEIDDPLLKARLLRVIASGEATDPALVPSALTRLDAAAAFDPWNTEVIRERGRLLLRVDRVGEARAMADDTTALDPLEPASHLLAARTAENEAARRASIARYLRLSGAALDISSSAPAR